MDFTLKKYRKLCSSLKSFGYNFYGIRDFILGDVKDPFVIMRHDVDRSPKKAVIMAQIENDLGISSTFNFRTVSKKLFDVDRMKKIESLGHEIAYHYEVLVKSGGDYGLAIKFFEEDLAMFRKNSFEIKTATFHGSPYSKFDSRDIWQHVSFQKFGLIGLGYHSIDCSNIFYMTDTGRTFSETSANVRDRPQGNFLIQESVRSSKDIIDFASKKHRNIYLVTHPVRWSEGYIDWAWEYIFQNSKNIGKSILSKIYNKTSKG